VKVCCASRSSERFSGRRARLLLLVVATVVSLALLAVLDRQLRRRLHASDYPDYGQYVQPDDSREGGYFLPNLNILATGEFSSRPIRLITNSVGFRNSREFHHQVPTNTSRVLFMGDSYVAGFRTDQQETIGHRLEQHLKADSRSSWEEHEVLVSCENNPAASWYRYQEHGRKYDSHLVLLGITVGNDITPRDYKTTLWPARDDPEVGMPRLVKSRRPAEAPPWKELLLPPDAYREKAIGDLLLSVESKGRRFLARRFARFGNVVPPEIGKPDPNLRFHVHAGGNLTSLGLFYTPLMPEVDDWFREFHEIVGGMRQQVLFNGSEFLIVIFPTRFQVDDRDWRALTRFYGLNASKFDLDYPNRRVLEICRQAGISCLDLTPRIREAIRDHGDRLFMGRGDMHLNAAGQALAAEAIGEFISAQGPVR
jgi:hypothetical protein